MRKNRGFTLLEVQISAMLMIVVLIATGVIFYFSLASIRYMHDAFVVYTNATAAMKLITNEVMVSNCYGSARGPAAANPDYSFYGFDGYIHPGGGSGQNALDCYFEMPTLGGSNDMVITPLGWGDGLFLRQATQASTIRGEAADIAGDFPAHEIVQIYRVDSLGVEQLVIDRSGAASTQVIANNVTEFAFKPIAYNAVHVRLTVQGTVLDPMDTTMSRHSITLSKQITLRCAPSVTPIPSGVTW